MNTYNTVDQYLQNVESAKRTILEHIRALVQQTVQDAEQSISYGMPAFKYRGKPLVYYGAFKHHMSLFPTAEPTEILKDKLTDFVTTKGTVQFTEDHQLSDDLIIEMLHIRMAAIG